MANHRSTIRQADVSRAVKGAIAAGLVVSKVQVHPDGTVTIVSGAFEVPTITTPDNEWDAVLHEKK